jgi:hypothetical protein
MRYRGDPHSAGLYSLALDGGLLLEQLQHVRIHATVAGRARTVGWLECA